MDQQAQDVLAKGETIVFGSRGFTSDGQITCSGRLLSRARDTPDARAFKLGFVNSKLASMKISEDIAQQHPEGFKLAGKLRQLEKTRHLCEFLMGSFFCQIQPQVETGANSEPSAYRRQVPQQTGRP